MNSTNPKANPVAVAAFLAVILPVVWFAIPRYLTFAEQHYPPLWVAVSSRALETLMLVTMADYFIRRQWLRTFNGAVMCALVLFGVVYPFVRWGLQ
jgi:hypothetical protein